MRFVLALLLIVHGFAHTVGFVVPWRIATLDDAPYKTTIIAGRMDIGHIGIRLIGLLWLLTGLLFFAAGALVIAREPFWQPLALGVALFSLGLCIIGLPESRFGIVVNCVLLLFVIAGGTLGWLRLLVN